MLYFRFAKTRESEESTGHKSFPVSALAAMNMSSLLE